MGNLAYPPSADSARWLLTTIFPAVTAARPATTITFVGAGPPAWLRQAAREDSRIMVTGLVPDVAVWLDRAAVVVCPIRVGGGVKVKVLEALSGGCAIVTTPIGMQGLGRLSQGAVVVEADGQAVAGACLRLLSSIRERERQQQRALHAARLLPTWDQAAAALAAAWVQVADGISLPLATACPGQ